MIKRYLDVLPPILMVVTDEEEGVIDEIQRSVRHSCEVYVWNESIGVLKSDQYIEEWKHTKLPEDKTKTQLLTVLKDAYKTASSPMRDNLYYIILDVDQHLKTRSVCRMLKNIAISSHKNPSIQRSLILISETGHVPSILQNYVEVVYLKTPNANTIKETLLTFEKATQLAASEPDLTSEQKEVLANFRIPANRDPNTEIPKETIAACSGLSIYKLKEMLNSLLSECNFEITNSDILRRKRELLGAQNFLEMIPSSLTFDDIAGMSRLKGWLKEASASFTDEGKEWGLPPCKGVLLVGIPGCGKSLTAKALGNQMDLPVLKFDPGKVFGSLVGESERNMRRALSEMEAMSPCVVWIDEIEKGFSGIKSSGRSDSGTTSRVIGTFLSWYEDHQESVFLIATANGIDTLPPEMISRFEEIFFVDLPDQKVRHECFDIQTRKYWKPAMGDRASLDLDKLAELSEGMTGREIEKSVKEGLRHAFVRGLEPSTEMFVQAIKEKPPISRVLSEEIGGLVDWVSYDEDRDEGVRARFASEPTRFQSNDESDSEALLDELLKTLDPEIN